MHQWEALLADPAAQAAFAAERDAHRHRRAQHEHRTAEPRPGGPTRWQVVTYWHSPEGQARLPSSALDAQDGEPACMACGKPGSDRAGPAALPQQWNRSGLNRAHLIPHTLGGPFTAANVVLLCDLCHLESEPLARLFGPEAVLRWVGNHEPWPQVLARHLSWAAPPELAELTADFILDFYGLDRPATPDRRPTPDGAAGRWWSRSDTQPPTAAGLRSTGPSDGARAYSGTLRPGPSVSIACAQRP
jgi:hypothetical protein